jgi:hypothetical protein
MVAFRWVNMQVTDCDWVIDMDPEPEKREAGSLSEGHQNKLQHPEWLRRQLTSGRISLVELANDRAGVARPVDAYQCQGSIESQFGLDGTLGQGGLRRPVLGAWL